MDTARTILDAPTKATRAILDERLLDLFIYLFFGLPTAFLVVGYLAFVYTAVKDVLFGHPLLDGPWAI